MTKEVPLKKIESYRQNWKQKKLELKKGINFVFLRYSEYPVGLHSHAFGYFHAFARGFVAIIFFRFSLKKT